MSVETDLYTTLSGNAGVVALVVARIYPNLAPESATNPCITYFVVSGTRDHTLTGVNDARKVRVQISCHGNTYASAKAVAGAVETALEGDGYLDSEFDLYDSETQTHTVAVDWLFIEP